MIQALNTIVTVLIVLTMPLLAFPFSYILTHARELLDAKMNWDGENAEALERVEDVVTHTIAFLATVVFVVFITALYTWWFQTYAIESQAWLREITGGSILAPVIFAFAISVSMSSLGWRSNSNDSNQEEQ